MREGIQDGSVSLAFRRWKRSQVVAGHRYRMGAGAGLALVTAVDIIEPLAISDTDALAAGFSSAAEVLDDLAGSSDTAIYRIAFRAVQEADPRDVLGRKDALGPEDLAELNRRLDRLDRSSTHGAWTRDSLLAIAQSPGVRAVDLAPRLGWTELQQFKLHVRKLKALGLTLSLPVGYELSPRGAAYVSTLKRPVAKSAPF